MKLSFLILAILTLQPVAHADLAGPFAPPYATEPRTIGQIQKEEQDSFAKTGQCLPQKFVTQELYDDPRFPQILDRIYSNVAILDEKMNPVPGATVTNYNFAPSVPISVTGQVCSGGGENPTCEQRTYTSACSLYPSVQILYVKDRYALVLPFYVNVDAHTRVVYQKQNLLLACDGGYGHKCNLTNLTTGELVTSFSYLNTGHSH